MGIKGTTYPVLYGKLQQKFDAFFFNNLYFHLKYILIISVDDGAILDFIFDNFIHSPPVGFEKIMLEQSLL